MRLFRITLHRRMAHNSVANPMNILKFAASFWMINFHLSSEQSSFDLPRMSRKKDLPSFHQQWIWTGYLISSDCSHVFNLKLSIPRTNAWGTYLQVNISNLSQTNLYACGCCRWWNQSRFLFLFCNVVIWPGVEVKDENHTKKGWSAYVQSRRLYET